MRSRGTARSILIHILSAYSIDCFVFSCLVCTVLCSALLLDALGTILKHVFLSEKVREKSFFLMRSRGAARSVLIRILSAYSIDCARENTTVITPYDCGAVASEVGEQGKH